VERPERYDSCKIKGLENQYNAKKCGIVIVKDGVNGRRLGRKSGRRLGRKSGRRLGRKSGRWLGRKSGLIFPLMLHAGKK
jgi:hypothetical protein